MATSWTDYFFTTQGGAIVPLQTTWVRLVSNTTSTAYVSTAATTTSGLATFTALPADVYTVSTGPTSTGAWTATGDTNYVVDGGSYATSLAIGGPSPWIDVTAPSVTAGGTTYTLGADKTGVADSAVAINNAITAANANGGGIVYLPPGTYYCGTGPIAPASNVQIWGAGINATTIKANAALTGGTADLIRLSIAVPKSGYASFITIRDLTLDCSAQTAGNGMTLQGINYLRLENIRVIKAWGFGIVVGSQGGALSANWIDNPVSRNIICQGCGRGLGNDSIGGGGINNGLIEDYWCTDAADGTAPGGTAWDHTNLNGFTIQRAYAISATGNTTAGAFVTDFGSTHVTFRDLWVSKWKYGLQISSNSSGQVTDVIIEGLQVLTVTSSAVFFNVTAGFGVQRFRIANSAISAWDTSATASPGFAIDGGHDGIIEGNTFGTNTTAYAIRLRGDAGSLSLNPPTNIDVIANDVRLPNSKINFAFIDANGTVVARSNIGVNPVGLVGNGGSGVGVATPAVAATSVNVTNATGLDVMVYVTAGTNNTSVNIGGSSTGITVSANTTGGPFRVPAGQTIALVYAAGAPTWTWWGD